MVRKSSRNAAGVAAPVTRGDLQPEFQAALDADLVADADLGGEHPDQAD